MFLFEMEKKERKKKKSRKKICSFFLYEGEFFQYTFTMWEKITVLNGKKISDM